MYAFPKSARVRNRREFRRTMDRGSKSACAQLLVFAAPRDERIGEPRLGLVVSRKVGNSVVRNKVKRALREAFRLMRPELLDSPLISGVDFVAVARSAAASADHQVMAGALRQCMSRLARGLPPPRLETAPS